MKRFLLALACLVVTSGCGTTKVSTQVERAPWISIKPGSSVRLDLAFTCEDLFLGPELVSKEKASAQGDAPLASLGIRVSQKGPRELRQPCASTDEGAAFVEQARSRIAAALQRRLGQRGLQVVQGPEATTVLTAQVKLLRTRELDKRGDRVDGKKDKTCSRTCGTQSCMEFRWRGLLELESVFAGPEVPGFGPQRVERNVRRGGVASTLGFEGFDARAKAGAPVDIIGCSMDKVRARFKEPNYSWGRALGELERWLDTGFERMFLPYTEPYEVVLLDDDAPGSEAGIAAAEQQNWAAALQHFSSVSLDVPDAEQVARRQYNVAVAQMQLGKLEEASKTVAKARKADALPECEALTKEIEARLAARIKM